jgi:hypothetical protein
MRIIESPAIPVSAQTVRISFSKTALTWRSGRCSGQWHPASSQPPVLGATDLGFVRSVLDLAIVSLFERQDRVAANDRCDHAFPVQ